MAADARAAPSAGDPQLIALGEAAEGYPCRWLMVAARRRLVARPEGFEPPTF